MKLKLKLYTALYHSYTLCRTQAQRASTAFGINFRNPISVFGAEPNPVYILDGKSWSASQSDPKTTLLSNRFPDGNWSASLSDHQEENPTIDTIDRSKSKASTLFDTITRSSIDIAR